MSNPLSCDDLFSPLLRAIPRYAAGTSERDLRRLGFAGRVAKLASNEAVLGPSPRVVDLCQQAVELHRYPDSQSVELVELLAEHHSIEATEICIGNGSSELISLLCNAVSAGVQHAVIGDPSFVAYRIFLQANGVAFTQVPLRDNLCWNVDDLLGAVTPRTQLMFIDNPNNPTGDFLNRSELQRLMRELPPQVLLVVDEAYAEYATAPDFVSALQLRDLRQRCAVLRTFSKAYGLAALRVGYAVAPSSIIDPLQRLRLPFNVNAFGQKAAGAALLDAEHLKQVIEGNEQQRELYRAAIEELGFEVAPSQANFLLVDTLKPSAEAFELLARQGVLVRAMPPPIATRVRITVGSAEDRQQLLASLFHLRQTEPE